MRVYENAEQIADDLELLKLRRDISIEELKLVKQELKDDLSISNWMQTLIKTLGKLGLYRLAKKAF